MSVERQTKEMFPKQRRLCEQRRSTVASIRSCPARRGVCGTCERKIGCIVVWEWRASVPVWHGLECVEHAERKLYMRKAQKTPTFFRTRALIFCFYSFGVASSAFATDFGASASAAGASAFASASATGAAAISSSTTDCCTNCSFSSAVRI